MMWGKRLTKDQLIQMLVDIAEVAGQFGYKEVGIEFGQKTHHLGYDLPVERRGGRARRDGLGTQHEGFVEKRDTSADPIPAEDITWGSQIINYTQVDLLCDLFLGNKIKYKDNGEYKTVSFDGEQRPKLVLLGFSGLGLLKKRIEFCEALFKLTDRKIAPKYFLITQWHEEYQNEDNNGKTLIDRAADLDGAKVALHPFRYGPNEKIQDFASVLIKHPALHFMADTAHLWLANKYWRVNDKEKNFDFNWLLKGKLTSGFGVIEDEKSPVPPLFERIVAFHIKDWEPLYDPSHKYYSRGFTELGTGKLSNHKSDGEEIEVGNNQKDSVLGQFCISLKKEDLREKWVVFEKDFSDNDEKESLRRSFQWFEEVCGDKPVPRKIPNGKRHSISVSFTEVLQAKDGKFDRRKRQVIDELHHRVPHNSEEFVTFLQKLLRYLFCGDKENWEDRPVFISFWELSTRMSAMVLLNKEEKIGDLTANRSYHAKHENCPGFRVWDLSKIDAENDPEQVEFFEAYRIEKGEKIEVGDVGCGCDMVLWIPICNTYNFNQVEAAINIFVAGSQLPVLDGLKHADVGYQYKLEAYFEELVRHIGFALEKMWGTIASQKTSELVEKVCYGENNTYSMLALLADTLVEYLNLDMSLKEQTNKELIHIFQYVREDNELQEIVPIGCEKPKVIPPRNSASYVAKEWLDFVLEHKPFLFSSKSKPAKRDVPEKILYSLFFPLYGKRYFELGVGQNASPEVVAVVECNRVGRAFSSSEENTIREILNGFMPYYLNRLAAENRERVIKLMRHELAHPIAALDALTDVIKKDMDFKPGTKLRPLHVEWKTYIAILDGMNKSTFFVAGDDQLTDKVVVTNFYTKILMPIVKQGPYLSGKYLARDKIDRLIDCQAIRIFYSNKDSRTFRFPQLDLHVSKSRFFLVLFNLLNNALKFSHDMPVQNLRKEYEPNISGINSIKRRLQIDIFVDKLPETHPVFPGGLQIKFCDYGPGVDQRYQTSIFDESVREPRWQWSAIGGGGIGLWVVRRIVMAHGGKILLTKCELPTTFCMQFPKDVIYFLH